MADFLDLFSGHAASYASFRPSYPPALAEALAAPCPGRALAVDVGCGSGQLAVLLAGVFDRVLAIDASAEQIAHAAPHPRVTYRVAPAEATGLGAGTCDLAVAAQAAHWFDLPRYWGEVKRILKPGGVAALVGYGLMRIAPDLDAVLDAFYHEGIGAFWSPGRLLVDDGYRGVAFPFRELPPPAVAMTDAWTRDRFLGYVATWSAVKTAESQGLDPMPAFIRDVERLWPDATAARPVRWPVLLRLGQV